MISATRQRCNYIAVDYITANIAFLAINVCRYYILGKVQSMPGFLSDYIFHSKLVWEQILTPFLLLFIYVMSGIYNNPLVRSRIQELVSTFYTAIVNSILIYILFLINDQVSQRSINYEMVLSIFCILFCFTYIGRYLVTMRFFHCIRQKRWKFKAVIIGNSQAARKLARKIGRSESLFSYEIVGYVPLEGEKDAEDDAVVIPEEQLGEVCKQQNISTLIIVPEKRREKKLLELISKLFKYGCQIKVAGGTISFITAGIRTQDVYGEPLVDVSSPSMSEAEKNIKRLFDILLSSIALLVCLPFMGIVALLIKADSKGPVFYSQERVGYRQKPFSIYKFRSMTQTAEVGIPQLSKPGDMRITKIGRILRKYRIDELPQFWNIIKGDMSLVGPRPERPFYIEKITKIAPYYTLLHQVRPGLTSWGMVKFGYASTVEDMVKRCKYDLVYLSNMTLTVDLKIMIYTIKTVVSGRGV